MNTNLKFQKILDLENLLNLKLSDQFKYAIEKNIFIPNKIIEHSISEYNEHRDFISELSTYQPFIFEGNVYELNKNLSDEFYNLLHKNIEEYGVYSDKDWVEEDINEKLKYILNKKDKLALLNSSYHEYSKIFTSSFYLVKLYNNESFSEFLNWKDYITCSFEDRLFKYLTLGEYVGQNKNLLKQVDRFLKNDKDRYDGISDWILMHNAKSIMNICLEQINLLENEYCSSSNQNKEKQNNYKSRVFRKPTYEDLLFHIFSELNVLNDDEKADKGFQSVCSSFWKVSNYNSSRDIIYKPNVKKSYFIDHLNIKYDAKISKEAKGNLSAPKDENNFSIELLIKKHISSAK